MTLKTITNFIATIDPPRSTVVSSPDFIAIFGGAISKKKPPKRSKSKRDVFYWWLVENHPDLKDILLLPENFDDWSDFDTYSDLLLFEKDLGFLTSAVLIFLESPGSIAELGAFSQIDSLSERLIVVVYSNKHPKKSFISLGPIRSIQATKKYPNSVCVIPEVSNKDFLDHIPVIFNTLNQKRKRLKKQKSFKSKDTQHVIILILDLINLFQVIQKTEIQVIIRKFDVQIKKKRLDQILFLLQKTRFIHCQPYGNNDYYVPNKFRKIYLDYTSKKEKTSFKRENTKALIWNEIQSDEFRKHAQDLAVKEMVSK